MAAALAAGPLPIPIPVVAVSMVAVSEVAVTVVAVVMMAATIHIDEVVIMIVVAIPAVVVAAMTPAHVPVIVVIVIIAVGVHARAVARCATACTAEVAGAGASTTATTTTATPPTTPAAATATGTAAGASSAACPAGATSSRRPRPPACSAVTAARANSVALALALACALRARLAVLLHLIVGAAVALPVIVTVAVAVAVAVVAVAVAIAVPATAAAPVITGHGDTRAGREAEGDAGARYASPRARAHGQAARPQLLRCTTTAAATAAGTLLALAALALKLVRRVLVAVLAVTAGAASAIRPPPALAGARSDDFRRDGPADAVGHARDERADDAPAVGRHLLGQARHRFERRRAWTCRRGGHVAAHAACPARPVHGWIRWVWPTDTRTLPCARARQPFASAASAVAGGAVVGPVHAVDRRRHTAWRGDGRVRIREPLLDGEVARDARSGQHVQHVPRGRPLGTLLEAVEQRRHGRGGSRCRRRSCSGGGLRRPLPAHGCSCCVGSGVCGLSVWRRPLQDVRCSASHP